MGGVLASSHREAPFITEHPKVDGTDFYMFRSYEAGRARLRDPDRQLPAAAGRRTAGPNYFTLDPERSTRSTSTTTATRSEDLTFQFRFKNDLNDGMALAIAVGDKTAAIPLMQHRRRSRRPRDTSPRST